MLGRESAWVYEKVWYVCISAITHMVTRILDILVRVCTRNFGGCPISCAVGFCTFLPADSALPLSPCGGVEACREVARLLIRFALKWDPKLPFIHYSMILLFFMSR